MLKNSVIKKNTPKIIVITIRCGVVVSVEVCDSSPLIILCVSWIKKKYVHMLVLLTAAVYLTLSHLQ